MDFLPNPLLDLSGEDFRVLRHVTDIHKGFIDRNNFNQSTELAQDIHYLVGVCLVFGMPAGDEDQLRA